MNFLEFQLLTGFITCLSWKQFLKSRNTLKVQKIRVFYEVIPEQASHVPIALETSGVGIEMDVSTEAH